MRFDQETDKRNLNKMTGYLFVLPWELHHAGGVNQVVKNLMDEMSGSTTFQPFLLINRWNNKNFALRNVDGRDTIYYRQRSLYDENAPLKNLLAYMFFLPRTFKQMFSLTKKFNIRCINIHFVGLSTLNWIILKKIQLFKGKIIVSIHGLDIRKAMKTKGIEKLLWQYLIRNVDAIVACSNGLREEVLAHYAIHQDSVKTVYNGVNVNSLEKLEKGERDYCETFMTERYIVNIGTFENKKGHDVLLDAFKIVRQCYPDIKLVLVGRKGETSGMVKQYIKDEGFGQHVIMFENYPHGKTLKILRHSDIFVLPSRNEGFAVVLLEAGAFGKAVVATDICGVGELIEHNKSGWLVPPDNVEALAEGIVKVLDDDKLRQKLADHLKRRVVDGFTWRQSCNEYKKLVS